MPKITTTMSLEKETKEKAAALFEKMHLDMSTAVNLFLGQCVKTNGLPFPVKAGPTSYDIIANRPAAAMQKVQLGCWTMEDWASQNIRCYMQAANMKEEKVNGIKIFHAMFALMSMCRDLFETPGELALDIAAGLFENFDPVEDKELFDRIEVPDPKNITYLLPCGEDEQSVVTIPGFPACTIYRIEEALKLKRDNEETLTDEEIFEILQFPVGWLYALAKYRAETAIKNGQRISQKDMEFFTDSIMQEIAWVARDYDMYWAFPNSTRLGETNEVDCNIPN